MDLAIGFEPLTRAEQKIVDEVEKMFGDKDTSLKNIVMYSRLKELDPNDTELDEKMRKMKDKIKRINKATFENIKKDLKCLDKDGNIIHFSKVEQSN
jgi:predicted nuclease with TOPRIM domain